MPASDYDVTLEREWSAERLQLALPLIVRLPMLRGECMVRGRGNLPWHE